jgi:beta-galactosidase
LIAKLERYVREGGNLVLSCRTGHQDEQGHLWQARHAEPIYPLIGAEIEFYDLLKPNAPDTIQMDSRQFAWNSWGDVLKPVSTTQTWGTYSGDFYAGKAAVTFNQLGKGTVTYVGADSKNGDLEPFVLTKLYGVLHIPVEDYPQGVIVEYRDGFGIAMNYSDKPYEMKLDKDAEILIGKTTLNTAGVLVWKLK